LSYEYQQAGTEFLRNHPRAMLGDSMGLGKSKQALEAAEGRTLIIAPAMAHAAGVWVGEIAKWRPELDYTLVAYTSLCQRQKVANGKTKVLPTPRPEYAGRWDTVICDEAHYLKGRATTWTRAVEKLKTDRLWLLTGTPIPNWAHELYIPVRLLHPGDREFTSYWRWIDRWFETWKPPWGGTKIGKLRSGTTWAEFHQANLGELFLRRTWDDVPDQLPPVTIQTFEIPMHPIQRRVYDQLKKDFIATVGDHEIVALSQAAQITKLAKLATGLEVENPLMTGSGKLEMLAGLLAERTNPVMVMVHFKAAGHAAELVAKKAGCTVARIDGDTPAGTIGRTVQQFQAGQFDVLVGTLDKLAESLTLTRADTLVFLEHSWKPYRNAQAMRRIHRIGQQRPCQVIRLYTADSIDQNIQRTLEAKTEQRVAALTGAQFKQLL